MASKALSSNLLTQSSFLTRTLETLTTSERIGQISNLSGLAYSIQGIGVDKINFITMPNEPAADPNQVVATEGAKKVWKALGGRQASPLRHHRPRLVGLRRHSGRLRLGGRRVLRVLRVIIRPHHGRPDAGTGDPGPEGERSPAATRHETHHPSLPRLRQNHRCDSDRRLTPTLDHPRLRRRQVSAPAAPHRCRQSAQPRARGGTRWRGHCPAHRRRRRLPAPPVIDLWYPPTPATLSPGSSEQRRAAGLGPVRI